MTEQQTLFWQRVQELAKMQLKQSAYDYYVYQARLLNVENGIATIFLDASVKQLFWEQNLQDVVITAGFEVYDSEIKVKYVFQYQFKETQPAVMISENTPSHTATLTSEVASPRIKPNINPKYTFDNFVQGDNNVWAKSASMAVASKPGSTYNPLFLYGGPGLGKTHLLNAIGNQVLKDNPNAKIIYIPAEKFINEFIDSIRLNDDESRKKFKERYRNLDLLLIDDIQSLKNKSSTQEEFFNTFNELYDNEKQIVLTSDRPPESLEDLEERLVTRFSWGLTQDITPPDFETRIAILKNKVEEFNFELSDDTLSYLAGQFENNVRDLEGALKNINLLATARNIDLVTVEVAAEAIRSRKQTNTQMLVVPIEKIQTEVGNFYGVSVKEIKGTKRVQNIVLARQIAMYLTREMTDNSLPKIGKEFGNRDHSTVLHAYNKIKNSLEKDENLAIEIQTIRNKIR